MPTVCFHKTVSRVLPHKPVVAQFDGGNMTSDAGLLLLAVRLPAQPLERFRLLHKL